MARLYQALGTIIVIATISSATLAQCPDCPGNGGAPIVGTGTGQGSCCPWNRPYTEESSADLFYDFYQPGNGGMPARAFPAPYPTPA